MQQVILASQSPRRKELLSKMGVQFKVVPSDFTEQLDDTRDPEVVAIELGRGKAAAVAKQYPSAYVIGSDTIVTISGQQLAKPADEKEANAMISLLAGRTHRVSTSIVIICLKDGAALEGVETTYVTFKPYDKELTEAYVNTKDPLDKAGGYGIQSGAAPLIASIQGDYTTILGLPTIRLAKMLHSLGITAYPVELEAPVPQLSSS